MRHANRLRRLAEKFRPPEDDLRKHFIRHAARSLAELDRFAAAVPESHRERVAPTLDEAGRRVVEHGHRAWAGDGDPALLQWVMLWILGDLHVYNRNRPEPIPAALLDLYLANPGANIWPCDGCQVPLPFVYCQGYCSPDPCPVCGAADVGKGSKPGAAAADRPGG